MAQLQKGTTYITGDQVTAANLNALVDSGILTPGAVTDQTAKTVPLAADTILLHSAADTALRKTTMTQLFATPQPLGATTPSSVAATTGTFSSTLGVTGVATLGNGAILGTPASGTVTNLTGTASININGTVGATTPATGAFSTLSATGTVTLTGTTTAANSSLDITSGDPAIRLKWTTSPVADQNTFEIRNVGGTSNTHLQFRTINDAESVFSSKLLLWQSGGLYLGTGSVDPGAGNLAVTGTVTSTGGVTMGSWPIIGNDGNATYILQSATAITSYTAGTATGTLTNAPAAGNPTKWMTINDNGTLRRIPTW